MRQDFIQEMVEGLDTSLERASFLAALDADQLNWKSAANRWSIAQCLEHTRIGAECYLEKLRPALDAARKSGSCSMSSGPPRSRFMGRILLRAVAPESGRKVNAPKMFVPEDTPCCEDVVAQFIETHEDLRGLIAASADLDLDKIRLSSPVARVIRLNAADAFRILVFHAARHLNQAEGIRDNPDFPP